MIVNLVVMGVLRAVMVFMVFTSHKVINEAIKTNLVVIGVLRAMMVFTALE